MIDERQCFMIKFKVICPICGAGVITAEPKALVWEFCPGCMLYVWDIYDAMMAETVLRKSNAEDSAHAASH
jgi:Zn-finger nucleic acid-binding protein